MLQWQKCSTSAPIATRFGLRLGPSQAAFLNSTRGEGQFVTSSKVLNQPFTGAASLRRRWRICAAIHDKGSIPLTIDPSRPRVTSLPTTGRRRRYNCRPHKQVALGWSLREHVRMSYGLGGNPRLGRMEFMAVWVVGGRANVAGWGVVGFTFVSIGLLARFFRPFYDLPCPRLFPPNRITRKPWEYVSGSHRVRRLRARAKCFLHAVVRSISDFPRSLILLKPITPRTVWTPA